MQSLFYPTWKTLEISEQPIPAFASDEVLLRVLACGICGSELETFKTSSSRRTPPLIMGHEFCGEIVGLGNAVDGFREGQSVISNAVVTCGTCRSCQRGDTHLCHHRQIFGMHRQGAFAEFVNVPASCLIPLPPNLLPTQACLTEPLANGVHVTNLLKPYDPKIVLMIGAGPIGLMCQQVAQEVLGTDVIVIDLVEERLAVAKKLGAKAVFNGANIATIEAYIQDLTDAEGVDATIDAVGASSTKQQSLQWLRPGGATVWIGLHGREITLDSYDITLPEKAILGSYAATLNDLKEAVSLMQKPSLDIQSWVHTFPLSDGVEAFHQMLRAQKDAIKGILIP